MEKNPESIPDPRGALPGKVVLKIGRKIDIWRLAFAVFDKPRPQYVAKVTVTDRILDVTVLKLIPAFVRPNYVTVFRFVSIPFIVLLFLRGAFGWASALFVVSAFSDAVDGAIARTRSEITDWGIVFDPITDKLLIGVVGGILVWRFLSPTWAGIVICMEGLLVASAYYRFKGRIVPAKTAGKIKMILESFGVGFIFLSLLTGAPAFLAVAKICLVLAIVFALASLLIYHSI